MLLEKSNKSTPMRRHEVAEILKSGHYTTWIGDVFKIGGSELVCRIPRHIIQELQNKRKLRKMDSDVYIWKGVKPKKEYILREIITRDNASGIDL